MDSVGMLLAGFGFLNLVMAALIYVSSELLFVANSARLLPSVASSKGEAMHISEGFLPLEHCIAWGVVSLPPTIASI